MNRVQIAAGAATLGPVVAALTSLVVGGLNPAYNPLRTSVSRLAEKGAPDAAVMNLAIAILGMSLFALAFGFAWADRSAAPIVAVLVATAGLALLVATAIQIDPASPATVVAHRIASGVAFATLALAVLGVGMLPAADDSDGRYRRASLLIGSLSLLGLIAGVGLLFNGFPGGLWERAIAFLTLGWAELSSFRLMSLPRPR